MSKVESGHAALLVLEDGTAYWGTSVGTPGETFGEVVFNTGMTGYQEVLTDPSYLGQIVVMTYPEVGIYGVNEEDAESGRIQVAGFVVHRAVRQPFNHRATRSFTDYLTRAGIVALEGVDTRALTRRIRTQGAMRAAISTLDLLPESLLARVRASPPMAGRNLVQELRRTGAGPRSSRSARGMPAGQARSAALHVVVVDAGAKGSIVSALAGRGARVSLVPFDASAEHILGLAPDGVLVSNGPGDPATLHATIETMRRLLEHAVPLGGICLGHQLLGLALGGATYKMRFGHRGINHPVKDLGSGRVLVTTQNHGFAVDPTSLGIAWEPLDSAFVPSRPELLGERPAGAEGVTMAERLPTTTLVGASPLGYGGVEVTQLSLNDGTLEGLRLLPSDGSERPLAISVQYHPEAAPGPHDAQGFFDGFLALVEAHRAGSSGEEGSYAPPAGH
jgi:carbamoyl-phosphate synthase small subunit